MNTPVAGINHFGHLVLYSRFVNDLFRLVNKQYIVLK